MSWPDIRPSSPFQCVKTTIIIVIGHINWAVLRDIISVAASYVGYAVKAPSCPKLVPVAASTGLVQYKLWNVSEPSRHFDGQTVCELTRCQCHICASISILEVGISPIGNATRYGQH